jgi:hypothetical protein
MVALACTLLAAGYHRYTATMGRHLFEESFAAGAAVE